MVEKARFYYNVIATQPMWNHCQLGVVAKKVRKIMACHKSLTFENIAFKNISMHINAKCTLI